jgi:hypothetical protein
MRRSIYMIVDEDKSANPPIVYIEDCNGPVSVTNDAENILRRFHRKRVVYLDTNNEWWEMYWNDEDRVPEKYIKFKPWQGRVWDVLSN